MRRSLRIRDRQLAEETNDNSPHVCRFCGPTDRCLTRISLGSPNMIGQGDSNRASTSRRRIEDNIDPREFLPICQDENLIFQPQPINLTINVPHQRYSKLLILTISIICASVVVLFVKPERLYFLSGSNSVDESSNSQNNNANLAYCYNFANYHAQRLARINRELKFATQKLEALYHFQHNMQKQTQDIQAKIGNLRKDVSSKITEALNLHDADKIGIIDYALESTGGYIISTPETYGYSFNFVSYGFMGFLKFRGKVDKESNPRFVIQPGNFPGKCYAFKGHRGRIQIGLYKLIDITAVTIEHASPYLVESSNSAPKDFVFYGLTDEHGEKRHELGCFVYRIDKNKPLQTFSIIRNNAVVPNYYQFVEFNFLTNHGNPNYTCVYRVRVHGRKARI